MQSKHQQQQTETENKTQNTSGALHFKTVYLGRYMILYKDQDDG